MMSVFVRSSKSVSRQCDSILITGTLELYLSATAPLNPVCSFCTRTTAPWFLLSGVESVRQHLVVRTAFVAVA